jgi:hypothetical protein
MIQPTLRIWHALGRSGATLVGKCLGSMQGVALLSEVHPRAFGNASPMVQGAHWLELVSKAEAERLDGVEHYVEAIALLNERAPAAGRRLVLRDWSHLDFYGLPFIEQPSFRSELVEILQGHFILRRAALVRHPIDQMMSLGRLAALGGQLDLERFLRGYRLFAELAAETGFVTYEAVISRPDETLQRLCGRLDVAFDPGYAQRWASWDRITGDIAPSRGNVEGRIRPLPRPEVPARVLRRMAANADYQASLALLGYEHPDAG